MRLRRLRRVINFLVCRVRIAPKQILLYRTRKQYVFLQHHSDCRAQTLYFVIAHVNSAYFYATVKNVVKSGDKLHKCSFCRACSAYNAYRFTAFDM